MDKVNQCCAWLLSGWVTICACAVGFLRPHLDLMTFKGMRLECGSTLIGMHGKTSVSKQPIREQNAGVASLLAFRSLYPLSPYLLFVSSRVRSEVGNTATEPLVPEISNGYGAIHV